MPHGDVDNYKRIFLFGKLHRMLIDRLPGSGHTARGAVYLRHFTRRYSIDPPIVGISNVSVALT
jgi:hypothetical protein